MSPQRGPLVIALALSFGALAGVLATLALGGGRSAHVRTITVPPPAQEDTSLAAKAAVPDVVGASLQAARARLADAGFLVDVRGASLLRRLAHREWRVTAQVPGAGAVAPTASSVTVVVARR